MDGWSCSTRISRSAHPGHFPTSPVYRGHARAAKFWRQLREPWEVFRIDVDQIEEEDDFVAAAIRFRATGADSGAEVDMTFGSGIRVRDGLATELVNARTVEEAREALRQRQPSVRDGVRDPAG
jgi:ketosteroid isomerase-like protein